MPGEPPHSTAHSSALEMISMVLRKLPLPAKKNTLSSTENLSGKGGDGTEAGEDQQGVPPLFICLFADTFC